VRYSLFSILFSLSFFLFSCAPAPQPAGLFFYVRMGDVPTLVTLRDPGSTKPLGEVPLAPPPACSFWSLTPAPSGPLAAVEWQCPHGPLAQFADVQTANISLFLDDPSIDGRFLAWSPDGKSAYFKVATLSNPQIVHVDIDPHRMTALALSPNTYNLTVSPSDGTVLWAVTHGIGRGSELWAADGQSLMFGGTGQKILSDPLHIIGLMRYSPDGARVAAIRLPDGQTALPPGELWLADSDGGNPHLAATADAGRGMFPVWSPSGEKIAFIGRDIPTDPASMNLSILTVTTTAEDANLSTFHLEPSYPPAWSPDSRHLYFTLVVSGTMEIWFHEISTGKTEKLFEEACCAGWIGE